MICYLNWQTTQVFRRYHAVPSNFYGGVGVMEKSVSVWSQTSKRLSKHTSHHAKTSAVFLCACNFHVRTQALICSLLVLSKGTLGFPKEFEQSSATLFPFILTDFRGFIAFRYWRNCLQGRLWRHLTVWWIQFSRETHKQQYNSQKI